MICRKMIFFLMVLILAIMIIPAALASSSYTLQIDIDFVPNLIFSTYDVDLYLNDTKLATLPHGEDYAGSFIVAEGQNTIYFYRNGKKKVKGSIEMDVTGNVRVSCQLFCYSEKVDPTEVVIETVENAAEELTDIGAQEEKEIAALQAFYDDFMENGTADNLKELAEKYGLYTDYRNTGTGYYYYKVASTKDQAKVISNSDLGGPGNYIVIKVNIFKDNLIDSVLFHKNSDDIKPEGDYRDETLKGHGYSDAGRSEPDYVNVIGYVVVFGDQEYAIEKADDFTDPSLWQVEAYQRNDEGKLETMMLPHGTEVVVREQHLYHQKYGNYSGTLVVERPSDGAQFEINVNNFITKPYWNYQDDLNAAAMTGPFLAEYHQVSGFLPVTSTGKEIEVSDGMIVLVTHYSSKTSNPGIEGIYGRSKSKLYFNQKDLTIILLEGEK